MYFNMIMMGSCIFQTKQINYDEILNIYMMKSPQNGMKHLFDW